MTYKPMTRSNYEYLADKVAPLMGWPSQIVKMAEDLAENNPKFQLMGWPSQIVKMAEDLAENNPKFQKEKFIVRAVAAWEANNLEDVHIDDHIPY